MIIFDSHIFASVALSSHYFDTNLILPYDTAAITVKQINELRKVDYAAFDSLFLHSSPQWGEAGRGPAEMMIKAEKAHAISGEVSCNYVLTDLLIYFTVCTGTVLQTKLKKYAIQIKGSNKDILGNKCCHCRLNIQITGHHAAFTLAYPRR